MQDSTYKKFMEKQNTFWLIVIGFALIGYGIYFFFQLQAAEQGLTPLSIPRFFHFLYNIGGKFLASGVIILVGIIVEFFGIMDVISNKKS